MVVIIFCTSQVNDVTNYEILSYISTTILNFSSHNIIIYLVSIIRYGRIRKPLNQLMEDVYRTIQMNESTHREDIAIVLLQSLEVLRIFLILYQTEHVILYFSIECRSFGKNAPSPYKIGPEGHFYQIQIYLSKIPPTKLSPFIRGALEKL